MRDQPAAVGPGSWRSAISDARLHGAKSLALDAAVLRIDALPLAVRAQVLRAKARALPLLLRGQAADLQIGDVSFRAHDLFDLGSLQSCLADLYEEVARPRLLPLGGSPVVVDVGANVGQFLTATKLLWPDARVTSFEPDPVVHAFLHQNAERLTDVVTVCAAAGDKAGSADLHRHDLSLMSSLQPPPDGAAGEIVTVDVVRLDDALAHLPRIDLLKIDVEGHELAVVRGALATLARTRHLVLELDLGRDSTPDNIAVLAAVREAAPQARIVGFGRPLGSRAVTLCQDVVITLRPP